MKSTSEKVAVFDTTLRDGEQAAGTRLGSREKILIAHQLAKLGVDEVLTRIADAPDALHRLVDAGKEKPKPTAVKRTA